MTKSKLIQYSMKQLVYCAPFSGPEFAMETAIINVANDPSKSVVPLWILYVAPPGNWKTFLATMFKNLEYTYWINDFTAQSYSAGTGNANDADGISDLLTEVIGKTQITDDMTPMLSMDYRKVRELLAKLVKMYDGNYAKFSPGRGRQMFDGCFNFYCGITPQLLGDHVSTMARFGQRYLVCRPRGKRLIPHNVLPLDEWRTAVSSLIKRSRAKPQKISDALKTKISEKLGYAVELRSWQMLADDVEGDKRLINQCIVYMETRASLYARAVNEDDFTQFLKLVINTIPRVDLLLQVAKYPTKSIRSICTELNVKYETYMNSIQKLRSRKVFELKDKKNVIKSVYKDILEPVLREMPSESTNWDTESKVEETTESVGVVKQIENCENDVPGANEEPDTEVEDDAL